MSPSTYLLKRSGIASLATLALVLMGCSSTYRVDVDAMRIPGAPIGSAYVLEQKTDGAFAQASDLARNALSGKGMYEASSPENADVIVQIDYGVGPQRMVVDRVPEAAFDVSMAGQDGTGVPTARSSRGTPEPWPDVSGGSAGMHRAAPRNGERLVISYVYEKHLAISARENPSAGTASASGRELWRVRVSTEDGDDSIETALPILAGAAVDHIGRNSEIRQTRRISAVSEPVAFVQGGR